MKNTLIFALLFTFLLPSLSAQENPSYWGIKAGLNISSVEENRNQDFNLATKTGLHAEVFRSFRLNDLFAIQAGLAYTERGGKDVIESLTQPNIDEKFRVNLVYLSLPLTFQTRRGNFISELGISPAYQITAIATTNDPRISTRTLEELWRSNFDLGFIAGVGYHINQLEFSVRAIPGILRVSDTIIFTDINGVPTTERRYGKSLVVQLAAAYRI